MLLVLALLLPSAMGFGLGFLHAGGEPLTAAVLSDILFFAALCNIIYSAVLFAANLGALKVFRFGFSLIVKLIFNKNHEGGKKLTERYATFDCRFVDYTYIWPQGVIGAVLLATSAILSFL